MLLISHLKEILIKKYNVRSEKCTVAYNGPYENFQSVKSNELIKKYENKKIILYVGLMTITDNIEIIIEAARKIIVEEKRNECQFILLGDGDVRTKMEKMSYNYGISENVNFIGMVDYNKVMEYLYIADVCIAPDLPNGLNENLTLIKVLEYMKAKKPFVAFDLFETKRMAKNSGMYASDIEDYINKILKLIDNPLDAQRMGEKGYEIIMSEYLWNYSEKNILQLYEKLLNK